MTIKRIGKHERGAGDRQRGRDARVAKLWVKSSERGGEPAKGQAERADPLGVDLLVQRAVRVSGSRQQLINQEGYVTRLVEHILYPGPTGGTHMGQGKGGGNDDIAMARQVGRQRLPFLS